ncbi:SgrR family transcriptional regulator [Paenibacillus aestuarii]|uniref:ABC transporter substrate-binding protein n=1 Tax=Paenibacillus aestuarii TaxID=516965 RepID=A0ABW0KH12_9BACL|nr:SgrR family transcriptional regulator [Paenibacillus aestuarii]
MAVVLHFLELKFHYRDQEAGRPFPVTVDGLSKIWFCSPRYVKLIVRKLSELGWIEWQAGRGRGNTSVLTLLKDADELLLREAQDKMEQGNVKEAMELMNRFGGAAVKDQFRNWLSEGMGISTETVSDKLYDTLRFPVYRTIVTLDPALVYYTFDAHIAGQMFDTLVHYEHESGKVVPCIAHSWENSPDGREWFFYLKKSVMFHHGRELTAQDVVFSLNRLRLQPERFESSWMFRDIEWIAAWDQRTVHIRLCKPNYLFLRLLATLPASIVPEDVVREHGEAFAGKPVGTGRFQMIRLDEGICVLEAFTGHFQGRPQLDRVEVLIFPESEAGRLREPDWTSVRSSSGGSLQDEPDVDVTQARHAVQGGYDAQWCNVETLYACCTLLVFNQKKQGPQRQFAFRQALHAIIDRQRMIDELGGDRIYPAQGFRPNPQPGGTHYLDRMSPEEIHAHLRESGYQGESFRLATTSYHEADALWIRERCRIFGVDVAVEVKHLGDMADHLAMQQYDGQLYGNVYSQEEICELEMYLQNNYFLSAFDVQMTAAVREETEALFREPTERARQHRLAKLEERIRDSYAVLYLVQKKSNISHHKSVRGVTINPSGWLDFHKIWFAPNERSAAERA